MSNQQLTTREEKQRRLERCLVKFQAVALQPDDIFFEHHFSPFPDLRRAKLGAGAYGIAYTVKSVDDPHQPAIACKVMDKVRLCSGGEHTIFHLCAELAVLQHVSPGCPRLNRSLGLFHDAENIYLLVSKVVAPGSSLETRLCHTYAHYCPSRLAEVPGEVRLSFAQWDEQKKFLTERHRLQNAKCGGSNDQVGHDALSDGLRAMLSSQYGAFMDSVTKEALKECVGSTTEFPSTGDLFKLITQDRTFRRRGEFAHLPEPKAAVIMKQILQGLEFMHSAGCVHRDLKPENIVVGVSRSCSLLKDPATGAVVGVQFREKIDTQIIDFGLVKHLKTNGMVQTPSPDFFGVKEQGTPIGGGTTPVCATVLPKPVSVVDSSASGGLWDVTKPPPAKYETQKEFSLTVTPCGTQCYMALESLRGYFDGVTGAKPRWSSTSMLLPKIDVFSCGVTLFAMNHGKLPFTIEKSYREPSMKQKVEQVMQKVIAGVQPDIRLQASTRRLITAMLHNDPRVRPTVHTVLNDPYFNNVTDTFIYNVHLNGDISYVADDGESGQQVSMVVDSRSRDGGAAQQENNDAEEGCENVKQRGEEKDDADTSQDGDTSPPLSNAEFQDLMDAVRIQEDCGGGGDNLQNGK